MIIEAGIAKTSKHPLAYQKALELLSARPEECLFAADTLQNLLPARAIGMTTVLVGGTGSAAGVDHHISEITELEEALGPLLQACS